MIITRNNYEPWFLDYLEGNLDERMINEFLEFIRENPDLAEELHLFEPVSLQKSDLVYSDKKRLLKEVFDLPGVFDTTAVGFWEGDLDQDKQMCFNNYMKHHPEKYKELRLYKETKLTPDTAVHFKNKQLLYRQPVIRIITTRILRIAAVFILIFSSFPLIEKQSADMYSGNTLTIFTSDNITSLRPEKSAGSVTTPSESRLIIDTDKPRETRGKGSLPEKKYESPTPVELQASIVPVREYQPPLLSSINTSPVYAIQSNEPELITPSIYYEIASLAEPVRASLSSRFFQKVGLSSIHPEKVIRWGLSLAADLTKEKFNYSTDASGEIIALNLDTRLVGVSIPVNKK
jgi:hypothetical protein